ncbi:MAG: hypothetical protein ACRDZM_03655, partial [Acidimicrobiia bacterium]
MNSTRRAELATEHYNGARTVDYTPTEPDTAIPASGGGYADLRAWLRGVDQIGQLRVVEGADWEENIGRVS